MLAVIQCGAPPEPGEPATGGGDQPDPAALAARLDALDHDLALGGRGDDVRAVHAYLARYGYLPNDELRRSYPRWRPVVAQAPLDAAVYDDVTVQAVRAVQSRFSLPVTGVVDAPTRELMRTPRCSFPESAPVDPSEKYSLLGTNWPYPSPTVRWTVRNTAARPIPAALGGTEAVATAVAAALAKWGAETSVTFLRVPDDAALPLGTVIIVFEDLLALNPIANTPPNPGGFTFSAYNTRGLPWSLATTTPTSANDLHSVLLHELGHALGLAHSGYNWAVMYPSINPGQQRRSLTIDDQVGISVLYDTWRQLPEQANDIAVGAGGDVWIVGTVGAPGGFQIKKWNGTGWDLAGGNRGGLHIAVDPASGKAWITDNVGGIYTHDAAVAATTWTKMTGCGTDIGISDLLVDASSTYYLVWKIGCVANGSGDRDISRAFRRSASTTPPAWTVGPGAANRVSVSASGKPWVVEAGGGIFRFSTNDPATGAWEQLNGWAHDIGVGPDTYAWITGMAATSNGFQIWNFDEQASAAGMPPAPQTKQWVFFDSDGTEIAVSKKGQPFVISADKTIWTVNK